MAFRIRAPSRIQARADRELRLVITCVFWNIHKNESLFQHLACLQQYLSVDVFFLAEAPVDLGPALAGLNTIGSGFYIENMNASAKVRAIGRPSPSGLVHRFTGLGREMAVWSLASSKLDPPEVLLAGIHLPSKAGGNQDVDQFSVVREVIEELAEIEDLRNHRQTILFGDFNMHPYDPAMTSATGIHAHSTKG